MEQQIDEFESASKNEKWIDNVLENIKNLEEMERIAMVGCVNILKYAELSPEQKMKELPDIQFQNLKQIIGELKLLLTDLTPIMDEKVINAYIKDITRIGNATNNRKLFIDEPYSRTRKSIIYSKLTPFFWETLNHLMEMRRKILKDNASMFYVKKSEGVRKMVGGDIMR